MFPAVWFITVYLFKEVELILMYYLVYKWKQTLIELVTIRKDKKE